MTTTIARRPHRQGQIGHLVSEMSGRGVDVHRGQAAGNHHVPHGLRGDACYQLDGTGSGRYLTGSRLMATVTVRDAAAALEWFWLDALLLPLG